MQIDQDLQVDLQVACDDDVVLGVLVVLVELVDHDGGVLLFHDGALPRVAPHCYRSTRYTRNISSSTSCS